MRKVLAWYNLLINDGMTSFVEENEESAAE
jgi:hypothetical protein